MSSEVCGDVDSFDLGDTVEYTLSKGKGNKISAEKVTKIAAGMLRLFIRFEYLFASCECNSPVFVSEWSWRGCEHYSVPGKGGSAAAQCGPVSD